MTDEFIIEVEESKSEPLEYEVVTDPGEETITDLAVNGPEPEPDEETKARRKIFAARLQLLMAEKKMNTVDLAKATGIPNGTISRYLNQKRSADIGWVVILSRYFNVSVDWMIGMTDIRESRYSPEAMEVARLYMASDKRTKVGVMALLNAMNAMPEN